MFNDSAMICKQETLGHRKLDITIGENLDLQIQEAEIRLANLKATKERLENTGLIEARIDDLRVAMSF